MVVQNQRSLWLLLKIFQHIRHMPETADFWVGQCAASEKQQNTGWPQLQNLSLPEPRILGTTLDPHCRDPSWPGNTVKPKKPQQRVTVSLARPAISWYHLGAGRRRGRQELLSSSRAGYWSFLVSRTQTGRRRAPSLQRESESQLLQQGQEEPWRIRTCGKPTGDFQALCMGHTLGRTPFSQEFYRDTARGKRQLVNSHFSCPRICEC